MEREKVIYNCDKGVDSKNRNGEWIILVIYVIEINV